MKMNPSQKITSSNDHNTRNPLYLHRGMYSKRWLLRVPNPGFSQIYHLTVRQKVKHQIWGFCDTAAKSCSKSKDLFLSLSNDELSLSIDDENSTNRKIWQFCIEAIPNFFLKIFSRWKKVDPKKSEKNGNFHKNKKIPLCFSLKFWCYFEKFQFFWKH